MKTLTTGRPSRRVTGAGTAAVLLLAAAVLLPACDPQRVDKLEEGVSTEVQVRQQFGEPVTITTLADGSRVFEYPRQPEGWANYRITIGADGKMSSLRQLLHEGNFARIQPGMGALEVRELLGRPARTTPYPLKNEEVWDWRFKQNNQDSKFFSVTFGADQRVIASSIGEDPREQAGNPR